MNLIKLILSRFRAVLELTKYNDFTIEEYFRKQGAQVGKNNRLEIRNLGPEPYLIKIGNHCTVAPNVAFLTHDGGTWIFTEEHPSLQKFGAIEILDNCFIGMNAIIMGNVKIGPNSIVGAGSVVTKDVPPHAVVGGVPAKFICSIDDYREKVLRIWTEQKPPNYFAGLEVGIKYPPEHISHMKARDFSLLRNHLINLFWRNESQKGKSSN